MELRTTHKVPGENVIDVVMNHDFTLGVGCVCGPTISLNVEDDILIGYYILHNSDMAKEV